MQKRNMIRIGLRALLLATLAALLPGGSSCDDNLGDTSPGPVSFRVSIAENTTPANDASTWPSTSGDGRFVVFASRATNLAPSKVGFKEIFIRDRHTDVVENVSRLSLVSDQSAVADCDQPSVSADGRYVVFVSKGDLTGFTSRSGVEGATNVFRVDRQETDPFARLILLVTQAGPVPPPPDTSGQPWPDADCETPSISEDGNRIAFASRATNLGAPPYTLNGASQVYVADVLASTLTLVSHIDGNATTGSFQDCDRPMISADGLNVVFQSRATNLTPSVTPNLRKIFLSAPDGSSTQIVSLDNSNALLDNHCGSPSVSRDGRYVAFDYQGGAFAPGDPPNARFPVLRRDRTAGQTDFAGSDMFLFGIFSPVFNGDRTSISDDGRYICYTGVKIDSTGIVDLEVKLRDMQSGFINTSKGIVTPGTPLLEFPLPVVSGDGRWVFWGSAFPNQVLNDTNAAFDIFGYGPLR